MEKAILHAMVLLFFLGGLFGFGAGLVTFFGGGTPAEYGVLGIGGRFWVLFSGITIYIRKRIQAD